MKSQQVKMPATKHGSLSWVPQLTALREPTTPTSCLLTSTSGVPTPKINKMLFEKTELIDGPWKHAEKSDYKRLQST